MKFYIFLICVLTTVSLSAKTRLALLGTNKNTKIIADLVLSQNSDKFDFLERQDVEKILKEQKLSLSGLSTKDMLKLGELLDVELFAILLYPDNKSSVNLIVFNAQNGFRLINADLPGSIEKAALQTGVLLEKAQKKINMRNPVLLSFFTLRDADVPSHFRDKLQSFTTSLERKLSTVHDVVILEREHLDTVCTERVLTGRIYKLSPSAKLLRFEFAQGKSAQEINLILRITDPENKVLFRINKQDCLSKQSEKTAEIIKEILPLLRSSRSISTSFSSKEEAARLFKEYQRLYKTRGGRERIENRRKAYAKLFSAIALDHENLSYRMAALPYYPSYRKRTKEQYCRYVLQTADNLCRDFPQAKDVYAEITFIFTEFRFDFSEHASPPDQQKIMAARPIVKELRTKYYKELDKQNPGWNWREGIHTKEQFETHIKYFGIFEYGRYLEPQEFSEDAVKLLEVELNYLIMIKYFEKQFDVFKNPSRFFAQRCHNAPPEAIAMVIKKSGRVIDLLKKYPDKNCQEDAELLQVFKDYLLNPGEKEDFFAKIKLLMTSYRKRTHRSDLLRVCCRTLTKTDRKRVYQILRDAQSCNNSAKPSSQDGFKSWKQFVEKFNKEPNCQKAAEMIINNSELIFKNRKELKTFIDQKAGFYFSTCGSYPDNKSSVVFFSALKTLCPELNIEILVQSKNLGKNIGIYKWKLFFWNRQGIFSLDLKTKITTKISSVSGNNFAFYENTLIASGVDHKSLKTNIRRRIFKTVINVIPLNGTKSTLIEDLPVTYIKSLLVMDGRIYALSPKGVLFSCDLKGMNRKIEISPNREEQLTILDSKAKTLQTMIADLPRKCLLFGTMINRHSHPDQGIWEYYPATGKTKFIPFRKGAVWLVGIYPDSAKEGKIEPIDLYTDTSTFIRKSAEKSSSIRYLLFYGKYYPYHCPLQIQPGQFWGPGRCEGGVSFSGKRLKYLENGEIKEINIPFMNPYYNQIYPHPDGKSFIVPSGNTVFKMARKAKDQ